MKKLTNKDINEIQFKKGTTTNPETEVIFKEVFHLNVGEGLEVSTREWPLKTPLRALSIPKRFKKVGATYRVNAKYDNTSWVIIRTN